MTRPFRITLLVFALWYGLLVARAVWVGVSDAAGSDGPWIGGEE
jgi:hypothetical protein